VAGRSDLWSTCVGYPHLPSKKALEQYVQTLEKPETPPAAALVTCVCVTVLLVNGDSDLCRGVWVDLNQHQKTMADHMWWEKSRARDNADVAGVEPQIEKRSPTKRHTIDMIYPVCDLNRSECRWCFGFSFWMNGCRFLDPALRVRMKYRKSMPRNTSTGLLHPITIC
jgi:hypothetical protein